ncbi:MAG TPA: AmmeMemoRadiSam system radical SAM enzyme [Bryobacteraceae bacterium]|nr:AmmeMemoRadiSam system radical SAM enzyme [Bryobacteraceae bacterium]
MTLAEILAEQTREGDLYEKLDRNRVRCYACGHACPIPEGLPGVCKVRFNRGGKLFVPWGYVNGLCCDPIEKKPFFHVLPGARALSFGMLGCDLHCGYCQNWVSSQALRDIRSALEFHPIEPGEIVRTALRERAVAVVSTYNEPLITAEWAVAVFREARQAGLLTGFVSNGNATPQVLEYLRPWVDLYKVDLKSFDDRHYHELGGRISPILDSIRRIHAMGFWLEVVTLVVPGFNDSDQELRAMAEFLAGISTDIPWHVTAFHQDYKMTDAENTPADTLRRAARLGREAGLRFVYAGNLPGSVEGLENTYCPGCRAVVVRRLGFLVLENRMGVAGACPDCGTLIPGVWGPGARPREVGTLVHKRCG